MIRRDFFTAALGLYTRPPSIIPSMGNDRREWLRWRKDVWEVIEVNEVKAGDIVLQLDVFDGKVSKVEIFCAKDKSKDNTGIEVKWYVDIDALAKKKMED